MGKGINKKVILPILIVMIALATVNVVRAIYDTDTKNGTYTKATAYVCGTYSGGKVYSPQAYLSGEVLNDLPDDGIVLKMVPSYVDDSGYHEGLALVFDGTVDEEGESRLAWVGNMPSWAYSVGMGQLTGYGHKVGDIIYYTSDAGNFMQVYLIRNK